MVDKQSLLKFNSDPWFLLTVFVGVLLDDGFIKSLKLLPDIIFVHKSVLFLPYRLELAQLELPLELLE